MIIKNKEQIIKKGRCDWKPEDCQYCEFGDTLTKEEQENCPYRKKVKSK